MSTPRPSSDPTPVSRMIAVPDGRLHVLDWGGCGTPVHLLHANGFCAGTYAPFVRRLTDRFRVVASDVRGHGDSVRLEARRIRHWSVFADDLTTVVSTALPPPVVGIGHSLGAVATLIAAARQPALFAAAVLIDPPVLPAAMLWGLAVMRRLGLEGRIPLARGARRRMRVFASKKAAFERFAAGRGIFKRWSPEFIDAYLECGLVEKDPQSAVLKCDPELEAQIFESIPTDIWHTARRVTCPTLLIRGEASDTLGPRTARRLCRSVPDCRLVIIPGTGHFPPMEQPEACAEFIADFVDRRVPPLDGCRLSELKAQG